MSADDTVRALSDLSAAVLRELGSSGEYDAAARRFREMSEACWEMHAANRAHDAAVKSTNDAFERADRAMREAIEKTAVPADEAAP